MKLFHLLRLTSGTAADMRPFRGFELGLKLHVDEIAPEPIGHDNGVNVFGITKDSSLSRIPAFLVKRIEESSQVASQK